MKPTTILMCALLVGGAACGKKKQAGPADKPAPTEPTPPVAATPTPEPTPEPVAAAPVEVPTAMDFEETAAQEITDKNVEARIKALEAELVR